MPGLQGGAPQASSAAHLLQLTPRSVPVVSRIDDMLAIIPKPYPIRTWKLLLLQAILQLVAPSWVVCIRSQTTTKV